MTILAVYALELNFCKLQTKIVNIGNLASDSKEKYDGAGCAINFKPRRA